jgi:hypothetical protein|tara:strand:+ start:709 stop:873 length:165 start_codon:yes stop_codon:yes gene_type:complete
MVYLKRKDGSVFGKEDPTDEQMKAYKKDGCVMCDCDGNKVKKTKKSKREVHRSE